MIGIKNFQKEEAEDAEKQKQRHQNEIHELRKEYLPKILKLVGCWLCFVSIFLIIYAIIECIFDFMYGMYISILPTPVLVALLGATSVNIIGMFYIVAKWLYPNSNHNLN